ncbi:response regulator [Sphingomonas koreensis]|nr:response regulator [Sphingomonas koreensis]
MRNLVLIAAQSPTVILVVEDDPLLRMAAIDLVERQGFTALSASDADEAVRILETRLDITIVFTDIDMPGSMDGLKLAAAVRDRWPPIHIIVTSGRCSPGVAELPPGSLFFAKPYSDQAVSAALRSLTL